MNLLFEKNLISTKDAGELSGYTSDYLARLARSGKIIGKRIGHSWFIDKDSLSLFLSQQGDRKVEHSRTLARTREAEYRAHHSLPRTVLKTLSKPLAMPSLGIGGNALRSQALALSVALLVVVSGAMAARASAVPQFGAEALALAHDVASGFNETFGD